MRWLFTFAVLAKPLKHRATQICASVIDGGACLGDVEDFVAHAVAQRPEDVLFYRAVMEPWSGAHRELAFWVIAGNPALFTPWRQLVTFGVMCVAAGSAEMRRLARPPKRDIRRAATAARKTVQSAQTFLEALFDALDAARAGNGTLVVTARILAFERP